MLSDHDGGAFKAPHLEQLPAWQIAFWVNGAWVRSYDLENGRGDVTTQTNEAGAVTWQASYEAFGMRTAEAGTNLDPQRGNTKDEDPTGLLNEGFRYRDLETGVWLSRDPTGFVNGPNLYCYVRQNPWSSWDPDGLELVGYIMDYRVDLTHMTITPAEEPHKWFGRRMELMKSDPLDYALGWINGLAGSAALPGDSEAYREGASSGEATNELAAVASLGRGAITKGGSGFGPPGLQLQPAGGPPIQAPSAVRAISMVPMANDGSAESEKSKEQAGSEVKKAGNQAKQVGDVSKSTKSTQSPIEPPNKDLVKPGDSRLYGELKAQKAKYGETEEMDMDHQPSFASQVVAKELVLGRVLTKVELDNLKANTPAVASPRKVHQKTSPTYGARNNKALQRQDAANPEGAAQRDKAAFDKAMSER